MVVIRVRNLEEAKRYEPTRPTYAIRIRGPEIWDVANFGQLRQSEWYNDQLERKSMVHEYIFCDIDDPNYKVDSDEGSGDDTVLINEQIASRILLDFRKSLGRFEELLVHCVMGEGRSPAVALALNDLFNLGEDSFSFSERYPKLNQLVYREIIKAGYKLREELKLERETINSLEGFLFNGN